MNPVDELERSLVPGTAVRRYDRLWRMGKWERGGRWITGRMGFEFEQDQEMWDEKERDFVERAVRFAQTVPFAVDTERMRVAFQLRARTVRPGTFRGNFQALLNEASPFMEWRVVLEGVAQPEWDRWLESVSRLVKLKIHMERPNPRYRGRQVKDVFEASKAAAVDLMLEAPEDGSLDPNAPGFVRQAIEHAEVYGEFDAVAERVERGRTVREPWRSNLEGAVEKKVVAADPETGEVTPERLREALASKPETSDPDVTTEET